MMKKTTPLLLVALTVLSVACNQKSSKSSSSSSNEYNYLNGGTQSGSTTTGSTTGTTNSGSTAGGTTSGTGTTPAYWGGVTSCTEANATSNGSLACTSFDSGNGILPTYELIASGTTASDPSNQSYVRSVAWAPGFAATMGDYVSIDEMAEVVQSDSVLKVRFRILPQPTTSAGQQGCYGRITRLSQDNFKYTKLRLRVGIVPKADAIAGNYLYGTYKWVQISSNADGIQKCRCSPSVDFSNDIKKASMRNGYVIVIQEVNDDITCQSNGNGCLTATVTNAKNCWGAQMQIMTDAQAATYTGTF